MSTTIDVIPTRTTDISFGQVLDTAERMLYDFLTSIGIHYQPKLYAGIHGQDEAYMYEAHPADRFLWKEKEYAWFAVKDMAGGTDAYCDRLSDPHTDPANPWWLLDEIRESKHNIGHIEQKLAGARRLDTSWYFRRSMGQPGIIAVAYGLIAAAVAGLTDGILLSSDGAWDYERFPATSTEFCSWYFRPEKALKPDNVRWAQGCIDDIKEQVAALATGKTNG